MAQNNQGLAGHALNRTTETPAMFDGIADRYDLLNRLLSFRRDVAWRKQLPACLPNRPSLRLLDAATGTADVLAASAGCDAIRQAVGLDRSQTMLALGRQKLAATPNASNIHLVCGDFEQIPAAAESFDAATIAFGIRNARNVERVLAEVRRVLKPSGRAAILELAVPTSPVVRLPYLLYLRHVLPWLGALVSGSRNAYRYLSDSVQRFPSGQPFCDMLRTAGFTNVQMRALTFGIAVIYCGDKK